MLYQLFQTFSHHSYMLYLTRYIQYQMRKKKFCIKISKKINIYQNCSRKIAVLSARTCMMSSMLEIPAQVCNLIAYSCVVLNSKFMHNFLEQVSKQCTAIAQKFESFYRFTSVMEGRIRSDYAYFQIEIAISFYLQRHMFVNKIVRMLTINVQQLKN